MTEYMGKWPSEHRETEKSDHFVVEKIILFPLGWYGDTIFNEPRGYLRNVG